MYHIHDELDYLTGYEVLSLNDKYLNQFLDMSQDVILMLCENYNQLIRLARRDEDKYIEEYIQNEENIFVAIKIKELHLYIVIINCLNEIYDRNVRG
jgi:hypothetical protein